MELGGHLCGLGYMPMARRQLQYNHPDVPAHELVNCCTSVLVCELLHKAPVTHRRVYARGMAKGSAKTHARSKKINKRDGRYLDAQALKEHAVPRPVTISFMEPELLRRHIQETARR